MYAFELASCGLTYVQIFMKIGTAVQAILMSVLKNFRGCNVGVTDGRDLLCTPL
jgi:hypothetical protein